MKKKIDKQRELEAKNLLEAASEIMGECVDCGLCKSSCVIFKALREEKVSGRGQAILLRDKILTENIFQAALDGGEEISCPKEIE